MSTEQEALKCAQDLIEQASHHYEVAYDCDCPPESTANWKHYKTNCQAAAMLRKLVAEREADRAAMREALEAHVEIRRLEWAGLDWAQVSAAAITDLRQRLEGTT